MFIPLRARTVILRVTLAIVLVLVIVVSAARAEPHSAVLVSFTAQSLQDHQEIYIEWETATELNTVGFFVSRSDDAPGPYARVSSFIQSEGSDVTGAQYTWMDATTVLSHTYYYRLEVVNADQSLDLYGPIVITAGISTLLVSPRAYLPLIVRTNSSGP